MLIGFAGAQAMLTTGISSINILFEHEEIFSTNQQQQKKLNTFTNVTLKAPSTQLQICIHIYTYTHTYIYIHKLKLVYYTFYSQVYCNVLFDKCRKTLKVIKHLASELTADKCSASHTCSLLNKQIQWKTQS